MKKHLLLLIGIFFLIQTKGQNYPYLNASTCNRGQMAVDKDTNVFMFHGKRLVKSDKNLNTIWTNTYAGVFITNLLLSKTGSIYFLGAKDSVTLPCFFGKLTSAGNLTWIKSIQNFTSVVSGTVTSGDWVCSRILLDKNNDLVIAGPLSFSTCNSYMIKSDTLGNITKIKCFNSTYFESFDILQDSSGFYKFVARGSALGGSVMGMYTYSDVVDNFTNSKYTFIGPYNFYPSFFKSKVNSSFYLSGWSSNTILMCHLLKFNFNSPQWATNITSSALPNIFYNGMEEDEKGNVIYNVSCGLACSSYTSGFIKLDSNGVGANNFTTMLKGYYVGSSFPPKVPYHTTRAIHENNYFFEVSGYSFPTNPLTIQKFNSSLTSPCSSTFVVTRTGIPVGFMPLVNPVVYNVTAYTMAPVSTSASPVSFSVNTNFCLVMGQNELINNSPSVTLFPNPTQSKIEINLSADFSVEEIKIFDINAKNVGTYNNTTSIDVFEFSQGIYFLKIKTDRGEVNRKFVKE